MYICMYVHIHTPAFNAFSFVQKLTTGFGLWEGLLVLIHPLQLFRYIDI